MDQDILLTARGSLGLWTPEPAPDQTGQSPMELVMGDSEIAKNEGSNLSEDYLLIFQ